MLFETSVMSPRSACAFLAAPAVLVLLAARVATASADALASPFSGVLGGASLAAGLAAGAVCLLVLLRASSSSSSSSSPSPSPSEAREPPKHTPPQPQPPLDETIASATKSDLPQDDAAAPAPLLPCIRNRRSVFPRHYVPARVPRAVMQRLLEAGMWAPYHGSLPPWRFVVLGRRAMVDMQRRTLDYYDAHWREVGWAGGKHGTEEEYLAWREMTEGEIAGRWGPVSYMVAIVMRRQAGSKRIPEWEEAAATACAVQNMHLQASTQPDLACYWSSWHEAMRDSDEMKEFLGMAPDDKCFGFFIVAKCAPDRKDNRQRAAEKHLAVEWRQ